MKWRIFLLLMAINWSCEKSSDLNKPFELDVKKCLEGKINNEKVKICFEELLEDSRCPINVQCIWQGVAKARFLVSVNGENHQVDLATLDLLPKYRSDTVLFRHKIKLVTVNPYPGKNVGTTKAELKITPQ